MQYVRTIQVKLLLWLQHSTQIPNTVKDARAHSLASVLHLNVQEIKDEEWVRTEHPQLKQ